MFMFPVVELVLEVLSRSTPILVIAVTAASSPRIVSAPAPEATVPASQTPTSPVVVLPFAHDVAKLAELATPPENVISPPPELTLDPDKVLIPPPRLAGVSPSESDQKVIAPPLV
jgi:hypothetical protein